MRSTKTLTADLVVVGGGAAGLFAALVAARRGLDVVLLEPGRRPGHKLCLTGKGRCNLTNDCEPRAFLENVLRNPKFLQGVLHRFPPAMAMEFFEELGVPLKTERGARVFPVSDKARDVADALQTAVRRAGVRVLNKRAMRIETSRGRVTGVAMQGERVSCRAALLCTGGLSYPATGSTGDGYRMAATLGHSIVTPRPSLVPLETDGPAAALQGLSLRNVTLSAFDESGALFFREFGELLFTHFGVSGPLVLSASARLPALDAGGRCRLSIDMKPALDEKKLDERILRDFAQYANRDFRNALGDLLPQKLIPVIIERSGIPGETKVNTVTKAQRHSLIACMKDFSLSVLRARPMAEAVITAGGVSVSELNPRTMESHLVRGLYFAGEIIDVDACTGGFNLQIAWSTAHAAASSIPKEADND